MDDEKRVDIEGSGAVTAPPVRGAGTRVLRWRVVDIVTAAVIGVACGVLFVVWNSVGYAWMLAADALTPGLGGTSTGIWLLGGVLGGLIIRKPGAAFFVEVLAATVSMLMGSQFAMETVFIGVAQGLGAELVAMCFRYRGSGAPFAVLLGVGSAVGTVTYGIVQGNLAKGLAYNLIYVACTLASGAVLAGLVGWLLTRALARSGVLARFASGREIAPG